MLDKATQTVMCLALAFYTIGRIHRHYHMAENIAALPLHVFRSSFLQLFVCLCRHIALLFVSGVQDKQGRGCCVPILKDSVASSLLFLPGRRHVAC